MHTKTKEHQSNEYASKLATAYEAVQRSSTQGFQGDDFGYFVVTAIASKLHQITQNDYPYVKPTQNEIEDILFNTIELKTYLDAHNEIEYYMKKLDEVDSERALEMFHKNRSHITT